jgi:hypothetical protein
MEIPSMRTSVKSLFVAAAVLALAAGARAQDAKGNKLPLKVFVDAKEGDWAAWTGTGKGPGLDMKIYLDHKIEKIEGDKITVSAGERAPGEQPNEQKETYNVKELTLETLMHPGASVEKEFKDVKVTDEKKKVGAKEFACKKVTCKDGDDDVTFWLSEEVKAGNIVAIEMSSKAPSGEVSSMVAELAGYGSKGKVDFGKSMEDIQKDFPAGEKK